MHLKFGTILPEDLDQFPFNIQIPVWAFSFRSSHFLVLVFGHFWRRSYENKKIVSNLCLYFARQVGQDGKKWKENHATKVTKIPKTKKTKIWDERNNYDIIIFYEVFLRLCHKPLKLWWFLNTYLNEAMLESGRKTCQIFQVWAIGSFQLKIFQANRQH